MRTSFVNRLVELAEKNERIFLICGDLGFSVLEVFRNKFPDRFLNIGIAEQNMTGVAAGLALEGYKVFIYSIGNFPSLRALEQIRYDICYHNLDVTIVSVGAGLAYGPLGCSHHATEDFAVMRSLPNMTIYNPCESRDVTLALEEICKYPGPVYLRLGKAGEPKVYAEDVNIKDFLNQVLPGKNIIILSTGSICHSMKMLLEKLNLNVSLYSVTKFSNSSHDDLLKLLSNYDFVFTVEEHQLNAGFGSFIGEVLMDAYAGKKIAKIPRVKRFGIENTFISVAGDQEYLRSKFIIENGNLVQYLKEVCSTF